MPGRSVRSKILSETEWGKIRPFAHVLETMKIPINKLESLKEEFE